MFSYIWPIALVVLSNVIYQVCAKSVPATINPFASLTVTYLIAAAASAFLYFVFTKDPDIVREYGKVNWTSFVLGLVIVGLEAGWIYAYKAGWQVSTGYIVHGAFLSIALLAVGFFFYHEPVTWTKIVGICVCAGGLCLINM